MSYNKEGKILSFKVQKGKSVDSDIHGNFVIDYDKAGNIVRLDIHNFNFNDFRKAVKNFSRTSTIKVSLK